MKKKNFFWADRRRWTFRGILAFALVGVFVIGCGGKKAMIKEPDRKKNDRSKGTEKESAPPGMADMAMAEEGGRKSSGFTAGKSSQSGLKAGYADDNQQYNLYLNFLKKFEKVPHIDTKVGGRVIIQVVDKEGRPFAGLPVKVLGPDGALLGPAARTYSDGSFMFFTDQAPATVQNFDFRVTAPNKKTYRLGFTREGKRRYRLKLPVARQVPDRVPVDIAFVFDTTGSMGEEIARLKTSIELIFLNLQSVSEKLDIRLGMVLYKDQRESYRTKTVPFTRDLASFQKTLNKVSAGGGGDGPEDLQAALEDGLKKLKWREDGVRLGYIITDAPPHLDYGQQFTYASAAENARQRGIRFFSIGTGGLPVAGEIVLRQIAQYTGGKYIFLTYGERGESAGGKEGSVSHHTGENFTSEKLETIIIRFTKEEIAHWIDLDMSTEIPWFAAKKIPSETREKTLEKLFSRACGQLIDFSTYPIAGKEKSTAAVLPLVVKKSSGVPVHDEATREFFSEQLKLALNAKKVFRLVARGDDFQKVMKETKLNMAGLTNLKNAAAFGKKAGAEYLVLGTLYPGKDKHTLFLKLVRTGTAEVLSVTKALIDTRLGL